MTDVSRLNWWEREKLLTPRDREAVSRAQSSSWEDIDENWAETDAGRYEVHVIILRHLTGGPEVAAAMLGWENAFHCEINPFGRAVLNYWFPKSRSYEDITKTDFREWRGKIDVLTGGFPCQPFSYAGKRRGGEDERYLWPQMLRAIDEIRPTWVVAENVAGLGNMVEPGVLTELGRDTSLFGEVDGVHRYRYKQPFTIERICGELERIGYSVQPVLIPAAAVGAPHRRDRIFTIAHAADSDHGDAVRVPGEHAGESGEERVRERNKVQHPHLATDVRPEVEKTVANTDSSRGHQGREHMESKLTDGTESLRDGRKRNAPDTDGAGLQEPKQSGRGENCPENGAGLHDRTQRPCRHATLADTHRERLSTAIQRGLCGEKKWEGAERSTLESANDVWNEEAWWMHFPTVTFFHAGNDGLPIRMDRASIRFTQWRKESLRAYGNAIVPQVMYEIFIAIEQAEQ